MNRDIQQLLQQCLEGYDAGLSPEECLSAYPHARAELEPLFRQALSLRIAYAAGPSPEFRFRAREKLLFAAGRDVKVALSSDPDPPFVQSTRRRLLNTAGAAAQEALRDVPPPRLPFWVNARRHLLETASLGPPKPAHAASLTRSALSAAVVVLAVAVAGAAFMLQNSPANEPARSAALVELDYISNQVATIERRQANGETVSSTLLDDLAERTSELAAQYVSPGSDAELMEKLPDLIQRQRSLTEAAPLDESVAAAQERLAEADEKVTSAAVTDPESTSTPGVSTSTEGTPEPTDEPEPEPTATPPVTELPEVTLLEPGDLSENQIAIQLDPDETEFDVRWSRVTTTTLMLVMPETWEVTNVSDDEDGLAVLLVPFIIVRTDFGIELLIATDTGEINTLVDGQQFTLRSEGIEGQVMSPESLAEVTEANEHLAALFRMLTSLEVYELDAEDPDAPDLEDTQIP